MMLHLPPTTISLTMTEVKEFERRRRFKKYLAKNDALAQLPFRQRPQVTVQKDRESEQSTLEQVRHSITPKPSTHKLVEYNEDIKLLSCPPRRPSKNEDSIGSANPTESSSSQSHASTYSGEPHLTEDVSLPIALPPPFSLERRVVSDVQSLPSMRASVLARESFTPELPSTPTRQPHQGGSARSTPDEPRQPSSTGSRIFSSAARFVESIVRFPRHSSPTPSARQATADSISPTQRRNELNSTIVDTSRFQIYDDSLPASIQPQTPMNLPEARHQSRLMGFSTVPVRPVGMRRTAQRHPISQLRLQDEPSPPGQATPGVRHSHRDLESSSDMRL